MVAIDTNVFIYALEDNPGFPGAAELLQRLVDEYQEMCTSVISLLEITVLPYSKDDHKSVLGAQEFIQAGGCKVVPVSRRVALKAAEVRGHARKNGKNIRTADSIQVATAILAGAELFVTADVACARCAGGYLKTQLLRETIVTG